MTIWSVWWYVLTIRPAVLFLQRLIGRAHFLFSYPSFSNGKKMTHHYIWPFRPFIFSSFQFCPLAKRNNIEEEERCSCFLICLCQKEAGLLMSIAHVIITRSRAVCCTNTKLPCWLYWLDGWTSIRSAICASKAISLIYLYFFFSKINSSIFWRFHFDDWRRRMMEGGEEIVKGQMQRERGKEGNVNVDLISKFAGLSSTEKKKRQLNKSYRQLHMKCAAFVSMSPNQKATRVETFRP